MLSGNAPTNIQISAPSILENNALGAIVNTFTTTNVDFGDSFAFVLVDETASDAWLGFVTVTDLDLSQRPDASVSATVVTATRADGTPFNLSADEKAAIVDAFTLLPVTNTNNGTIVWQYAIDEESLSYLAEGETVTAVFTITATDIFTSEDSRDVTVTITGGNDTPVITVLSGDSAALNQNDSLTAIGTLTVTDLDLSDTVSATVSKLAVGGTYSGSPPSDAELLDYLTIDPVDVIDSENTSGTLTWKFDAPAATFDFLAKGETLTLAYTITATDNYGGTGSRVVTITITGSNDAPEINLETGNSAAEPLTESDSGLYAFGTLTLTDPDLADTINLAVTGVVRSGTFAGTSPVSTTVLRSFLTVSPSIVSSGSASTITWTFDSDTQAFDFLATGETFELTYTITATDNRLGSDTQTVVITITGTDDAPAIAAIIQKDLNEPTTSAGLTTSIPVTFTDVDLADTGHTATIKDVVAGGVTTVLLPLAADNAAGKAALMALVTPGTVTKAAGSTAGSVTLTFSAGSGVFDYLAVDEVLTLTYTIEIDDNDGPVATQTFVVTITGSNDKPAIPAIPAITPTSLNEQTDTAALTSTIAVTFTDVDLGNVGHAATITNVTRSGATTGLALDTDALLELVTIGVVTKTAGSSAGSVDVDFSAPSAAFDYLADGQVLTLRYTLQIDDQSGATVTRDFVVTVRGTNDLVVITDGGDTESLTETDTTLFADGTFTVTDADLSNTVTVSVDSVTVDPNSTFAGTNPLSVPALKAMLSVTPVTAKADVPDGNSIAWNFTSGASGAEAFNFLAEGETLVLVYTIQATDTSNPAEFATATVTITITGSNDTPSISVGAGDSTTGTIIEGTTLSDSGSVTFTDLDLSDRPVGDKATKSVTAKRANNTPFTLTNPQQTAIVNAFTIADSGDNTNNGTVNWDYTIANADLGFLAKDETVVAVFTITVDDGNGGTDSEDVTVTITGANDVPATVAVDVAGTITEGTTLTDSGSVTFTDVDLSDRPTASKATTSVAAKRADGTTTFTLSSAQQSAIEAAFTITPAGTNTNDGTDTWDYTITESVLNFLAKDETVTAVFTITVDDGNGGSDSKDVTITITGVNDAPATVAVDVAGTIIEGTTLSDSGSVTFTDLDLSDRPTATKAPKTVTAKRADGTTVFTPSADQKAAIENVFTIAPAVGNTNNGTINWSYTITEAELDFLAKGETVTAVFTITIDDGNGGTDSKDITVTIIGTNDAPSVTVVTPEEVNQDDALILEPITVADLDSPTLKVTITVGRGTVSLKSTDGLTIPRVGNTPSESRGDGVDDAYLVFTGTVDKINAALDGITFKPAPGYSGMASIQVVVSDQPSLAPPTVNQASAALTAEKYIYINVKDTTKPTATLQTIASPRNTAINTVVVTFSEPVIGVEANDVSLKLGADDPADLGELAGVTVTGSGKTWTITGLASHTNTDGRYELRLKAAGAAIIDLATPGNPLEDDAIATWTMDATVPTAAATLIAPATRNTPVPSAEVKFSEAVTGVTVGDFRLTRNGSPVSLLQATIASADTNKTWTLGNLTAITADPGSYTLTLVAAGSEIVDAANNRLATDVTWTWTTDKALPTAAFATIPSLRNDALASVVVTFSEVVKDVDWTDFELKRGSSGIPFTNAVTVTQGIGADANKWTLGNLAGLTATAGAYTLKIKADGSGIKDTASNVIVADATTAWTVDMSPPTVAFETIAALRNSPLSSVTLTFSEAVTGLAVADFRLTRGVTNVPLTTAILSGSGTTWTLSGLSTTTNTDGDYKLELNGAVTDIAGTPLVVAPNAPSVSWTKNSVVPTVTLAAVPNQKNGDAATASIVATFSKVVTGVDLADFELKRDGVVVPLAGASVTKGTAPFDNQWTLSGLAALTAGNGSYQLALKAIDAGIADINGNQLTTGASTAWKRDTAVPTATFAAVTTPRNTSVNQIALTFSKPVTGVNLADFSLTRGGNPVTLTGASVTGSGTSWTISGLSALTATDGDYVLKLNKNASGIADAAGNALAADATATWTMDATPPTAAATLIAPATRNTPVPSAEVKFSEAVTGVTVGDFRLTRNGSPVSLLQATIASADTNKTWTLGNLTAITADPGSYTLTLVAAGSEIVDAANNRLATDVTWTWTTDKALPTAAFATIPSLRNDALASVVVTFSEVVKDVDWTDFELKRGSSGIPFTNAVTVTQGIGADANKWTLGNLAGLTATAGAYTLKIKADGSGIKDTASNVIVADATTAWTVDMSPPTVAFETIAALRNSPLSSVTLTFSEAVTGLAVADFRLTRGVTNVPLTTAILSGSGTTWTLSGLSTTTNTDGDYKLELNGAVTDIAGTPLVVAPNAPSVSWTKNSVVPTVTLAAVPNQKNGDAATASIVATFSKVVTGVDLADFELKRDGVVVPLAGASVTKGTAPFDNQWTLSGLAALTAGNGSYQLALKAIDAGIADINGNQLTTGASTAWKRDTAVPTATFAAVTTPRNTSVNQIALTFSKPVTGVDRTDFSLTRGGNSVSLAGATVTGSGTSYTITELSGLTGPDGTYVLKLTAADSLIADAAGNALAVDTTATWIATGTPFTGAISAADGTALPTIRNTAAGSVRITLTRAVPGLSTSSFRLQRGQSVLSLQSASLTTTDGGLTWTLGNLSGLTSVAGTYSLKLGVTSPTVKDPAGNVMANIPAANWTMEKSPPSLQTAAVPSGIITAAPGSIRLTFSEQVTNVGTATVTLAGPNGNVTLTGRISSVPATNGSVWLVNLADAPQADGDYTLTVGTGITDQAGNQLAKQYQANWRLDATAPSFVKFGTITSPQNAPLTSVSVEFSEAVKGVDAADFRLTRNGVAVPDFFRLARVTPIDKASGRWSIGNLSSLTSLAGDYKLSFVSNGTVKDVAGNVAPSAGTDLSWTLQPLAVTFTADSATLPTKITIAFSRAVTRLTLSNFALTKNGLNVGLSKAILSTTDGGLTWTLRNLNGVATSSGPYVLSGGVGRFLIRDTLGNPLAANFTYRWTRS